MAELRGALKMLTLACAHTASDCWSLSALRSAALRYGSFHLVAIMTDH